MFLKIFYPTVDEKKAIKTWCQTKASQIKSLSKKTFFSFFWVILDLCVLALFAIVLGLIVHQIFKWIPWHFANQVSIMLNHDFNNQKYVHLLFLYFLLGGSCFFPLLIIPTFTITLFKLIKGLIFLSIQATQNTTQFYQDRKELMLPILEKDKFEHSIKSSSSTQKKVKL